MTTSNEEYFDAVVRHQIYLLRLSGSVRNEVIKILNRSEKEIAFKIQDALDNKQGLSPSNLKKLKKLLAEIQQLRAKDWSEISQTWQSQFIDLAKAEAQTYATLATIASPVIITPQLPLAPMLKAIVVEEFFQGKNLKQWAKNVEQADINRIQDQIRLGLTLNESNQQIAARVIGTAKTKGRDGVTQISRKNAESITRTAINHIGNRVKQEFAKANPDFISEEVYVATLDGRTTAVCRANDGKFFDVGKGPIPPLHFNCRSLRVPVLDGKLLGERPSKPVTEKMILKKFSEQNSLSGISKRSDLPRGFKTKYDKFSRDEISRLVGQVQSDVDYQDWLKKQSVGFQNEVLGVAKGKLFRDGGLTLDKFVNRTGDELTLEQLKKKYAKEFKKAGL